MTGEPAEGQRPDEDFEIVEVDVGRYLTDEQRAWPVGVGQRPEQEFAIEGPLPALSVRAPEARLAALVSVLSEQETKLGGSGLELAHRARDANGVRATLVPRRVEGARTRFELIARWAAAFGSEVAVTVV
ncbi:hypothetical protein GobsT_41900 [Gemmata obscuriglobus]|uniref:Uncharacterized protein n=1 Tax=Gemmata obscuriglobus TaxID=114 RepID=A0A2Z3GTR1_9BACT|nr:hypothetical protein [Gemmata obscuriglobus]AWM37789.1 hypothetical protein C1280_12800 [Gemmata obscuriglobus]QEG29394.1 hypothetical protein GobsT_41900 [Gemmata obscuriglobus]VTS08461.1 unnamed protein product [Gemmata obscuriglobus UQM 2246]